MSLQAFKEGCIELVKHLQLETPAATLESMEPQTIFNHFLELKPFFDAIQKRDLGWVPQGPEWIREYAGTTLDEESWSTVGQLVMLTNLLGMIPEGMRQQVDQMSQMLMDTIKTNPNISENMATDTSPQQATEMMKNLQSVMGLMGGGGGGNPASALLNMMGADTGSSDSNRRSRRAASRNATRERLTRKFETRRTRRVPNKPPNTPNTSNTNP